MLGSLPTSPFLIEIPIRKVFRYVWGKRDCFQGRMMIDRQQHKPLSSDSMLFKKLFMMGEDGHYGSTEESQKKENPSEWLATNIQTRDVSWPKFPWIECEWDFTFHHLRETWNPWMTIFPIYWDFEWIRSKFLCEFIWIHWNSWNRARTGFHNHNLELKWNVIQWNAKNCFQEWIFYKHEFTHPSLICR